MTHTPGPWRVEHNAKLEVSANINVWTCELAHVYRGGKVNSNRYTIPEAEANARLIAAAPELLEALDEAVAYAREAGLIGGWIAKARAAIAKAKEPT